MIKILDTEKAAFILGYGSSKPVEKRSAELQYHMKTADQIFNGGAFNPINVWDMQAYYKKLIARLKLPY